MGFTSAHLTQISRGSLNAFGPFFKLKNKTLIFPETKSSGDDNQQGPQASTPQQIAELFNSYFVSVFTAPSGLRTWSAFFTPSHPTLIELEILVEMVVTSLKQLDINKATGSDGIPVRLLNETADQIAPSLTMLLNKSLRLGIFPGDWKLANIIPFFEKGKREFVENYCPISLLPVTSKVLKSHLIIREQHGLLAGRSCVTQLTSVLHYNGGQFDAGKQIDITYLDVSKAFDKVDHTKLLVRLHQAALLANFTTGSVHTYRDASNRLQFSEPLPENCQLPACMIVATFRVVEV